MVALLLISKMNRRNSTLRFLTVSLSDSDIGTTGNLLQRAWEGGWRLWGG